jgi:hypothetical protein
MGQQYPHWLGAAYGRTAPDLNGLQNSVNWLLTHLSWHFIFRPWLYLAVTSILIVACLVFCIPERLQIALIAASGLAYEGTLFFFAPAADF